MATHSSSLTWKIPWTEEPGRLQSTGSLRVGHDWATSLSLFTFMHWRRKWQPTPVFLPGESQGQRRLVGCHLWGLKIVAKPRKDAGILGFQRRIQSGARDEAWLLRASCNKVLLKYKGDRESFWHRHQKGVERVPPKFLFMTTWL